MCVWGGGEGGSPVAVVLLTVLEGKLWIMTDTTWRQLAAIAVLCLHLHARHIPCSHTMLMN